MSCARCGKCCSLDIPLTDAEVASGKYRAHYSGYWDEYVLDRDYFGRGQHKMGGQCVYLKGRRCSIYRVRPQVCRDFRCEGSL